MSFCYDEDTINAYNIRFGSLINGREDCCADFTFSLVTKNGEERKLLINSLVTKILLTEKSNSIFGC